MQVKGLHCVLLHIAGVVLWGITAQPLLAADNAVITKLLPFAGADRVRIDVTVQGAAGQAELNGRIICLDDKSVLWQGKLDTVNLKPGQPTQTTETLTGLSPRLWSPPEPTLYELTVWIGKASESLQAKTVRFGFRSFEARDGRFWLNGKPLFLRGNSINPPGRGVPDDVGMSRAFVEDYVRCLKAHNINIIRTSSDLWLDVCDEMGMMVFGGVYGVPPLSSRDGPTKNIDGAVAEYRQKFEDIVRHPSMVIYTLSNEMSKQNPDWAVFLKACSRQLKDWDPNRAHIGNCGFGLGMGGDIYSSHPYNGWYSGSFLDFLRYRGDDRKPEQITPGQPWMLTECVGSYTVSDGRFNIIDKQLAAQLAWTGNAPNQTELGVRYQAFLYKQVVEIYRRMRSHNPDLASVSPFTILFYHWKDITSFDQMKAKPVLQQAKISFQPVLLSWECWTGQVYAGSTLRLTAHVVNDSEDYRDLKGVALEYRLIDAAGAEYAAGLASLGDVPYYGTQRKAVVLPLPMGLKTDDYRIHGRLLEGKVVLSENTFDLFIAGKDWKAACMGGDMPAVYRLYDTVGKTAAAFKQLDIPYVSISDLTQVKSGEVLVLGAGAVDEKLVAQQSAMARFVRQGGRVVCLMQNDDAIGAFWPTADRKDGSVPMRPTGGGMHINPKRPRHPVFDGIDRIRLERWSDYTNWNETKDGMPRIFPVESGFRFCADERTVTGWDIDARREQRMNFAFGGREALKQTAVLADYGRGLGALAMCEIVDGDGSILISGFNLIDRVGLDPAAERLLKNLLAYAASAKHDKYPTVSGPIRWGDYASENGIIIEKHNGLIPNVVYQGFVDGYADDPDSKWHLPGIFNSNPDPVYVTCGRRLMGPYDFTGTCHNVDLQPDRKNVSAVYYVTVATPCSRLVHRVKNASDSEAVLTISVNGEGGDVQHRFPRGRTIEIETPVPTGARDLCVELSGTKGLVLLETRFE